MDHVMDVRVCGFASIEVEGRAYEHDMASTEVSCANGARSPRSPTATSSDTLRFRPTRSCRGADPG